MKSLALGALALFAPSPDAQTTASAAPTEVSHPDQWRFELRPLHAGYRWMDTDFEDSDFELDVVESGWILGLGIGF